MRYLLPLLLLTCGEPTADEAEETIRERILITYVCYNPSSIWHLSECSSGESPCTDRDYRGEAYCLGLFDVMCEQPDRSTFIRRACGLYYER